MGKSREQREQILWDNLQHEEQINPIELSGEIAPDLFGLEPIKAKEMVSGLSTTLAEREILKNAYIDVIELPITAENIPTFKELRLKIVKNRTQGIEKWHKTNKAFYLAGGRFVDAIKNKEVLENEQMEAKLLQGEKYFENLEKERLNSLRLEREELLKPFVDTLPNDLSSLEQDVFDSFLETKKKVHADKLEAERIEAERIENERIEREKQIEAQRLENERLKKEAEEKEKALKLEREENERKAKEEKEKQEAILQKERAEAEAIRKAEADRQAKIQAAKDAEIKKEREAREKLEAEAKAEKEAKEKAELEAKKEAEKLAKAPKKEKLTNWINNFVMGAPIGMSDDETVKEIHSKFEAFKKWSLTQINNL